MGVSGQILAWDVKFTDDYTIAAFTIACRDGILDHRLLHEVQLPAEVRGREDRGLVFSGRGPTWLYAHLTHLAHTFARVAVYDPRYRGAIVVQRHTADAPRVGEVVPCEVPDARDA